MAKTSKGSVETELKTSRPSCLLTTWKKDLLKVADGQTDEDIHRLCDEPKFSTVIDTSGWPFVES